MPRFLGPLFGNLNETYGSSNSAALTREETLTGIEQLIAQRDHLAAQAALVSPELEIKIRRQFDERIAAAQAAESRVDRSDEIFEQYQAELVPLFNQILADARLSAQARGNAFSANLNRAGLGATGIGASAENAFMAGADFGVNTLRARSELELHQQARQEDQFTRNLFAGEASEIRNLNNQRLAFEASRPGLEDRIFQAATVFTSANPLDIISGSTQTYADVPFYQTSAF